MNNLKESGQIWIGSVPSSWSLLRLGSLFRCRNVKVDDTNFQPLSVSKGGIVPQMETVAKTNANDNRKQVLKGDFVINSRSDRKQSCGVSPLDGSVSLINIVLYQTTNLLSTDFAGFLLKNYGFAEEFYRWGHGIVADLWTTRWQEMSCIVLPVPPIAEQAKIVKTLTQKISKIDALIDNENRQIELINNYKVSAISEILTGSLNKQGKTKDCSSFYAGMVPASWRAQKLLRFLEMPITDGPHETPELFDNGVPFISANAIQNGHIDFSLKRGYISEEYNDEISKKYSPRLHDIYLVKSGATTGKVGFVESTEPKFNIWSPLAVIRVSPSYNWKYVYYALQASYFQKQIQLGWSFGTQQNLSMRVLEQLFMLVPSRDEQDEICSHLETKIAGIDRLLSEKQKKITELEEMKKSMTYEYVTGKKEA
jgi:type I restriction enzyme, S subunit